MKDGCCGCVVMALIFAALVVLGIAAPIPTFVVVILLTRLANKK